MKLFIITRDFRLRNDLRREKENNEDFCRWRSANDDHPSPRDARSRSTRQPDSQQPRRRGLATAASREVQDQASRRSREQTAHRHGTLGARRAWRDRAPKTGRY